MQLWSDDEFAEAFPDVTSSRPFVGVANGDSSASSAHTTCAIYTSNGWFVCFNTSVSTSIRVNYVVVG